jgi:hypothetical protein
MAARTCPQCGTPAEPGGRFCRTCGTSLGDAATAPPPPGYGPPVGPAPVPAALPPQTGGTGFFAALFDFSFSEFITTKIIKVLYILAIIAIGLIALGFFIAAASQGGANIVFGLIIAPIFFLLYVILTRVWLEIIIVLFRIAEYTREIAQQGRRDTTWR